MLRSAPIALGVLVRMAWRTSPRLTLLAAVIELASGCVTAFGLLATANMLTQLFQQGPTPQRVVAALPALLLVMGSYAARGTLEAAVGAVHAVLAPRVELHAQDELHAAVIGVELVAFDDADFVELVRRRGAGDRQRRPGSHRCRKPAQLGDLARRRDRDGRPAQPGAGAGGAAGSGAQRVGQCAGREVVLRVVRADDLAPSPAENHQRPDYRPAGVG